MPARSLPPPRAEPSRNHPLAERVYSSGRRIRPGAIQIFTFHAPRGRIQLGLRSKLYIAWLATILVAVVATTIAVRISFVSGFLGYLNEQEIERIQSMLPLLAAAYEENGDWDFLREDRLAWLELLRGAPAGARPRDELWRLRAPAPFRGPFPMSESDLTGLNLRVTLLDEQHRFVIGNPRLSADVPTRPVMVKGKVVGWLVVLPFQRVTTGAAIHLQDRQLVSVWIIGLGAVLLAALAAVLLTHRLLRPIRRIAQATHRLAAGQYATRLRAASQDEIGRLANDFNRLAFALERNERMRRAFMADVSHELRTPLTVLRGELEAYEDGVRLLTPESVTSLQTEVTTLSKLVNDLYELSLADIGALAYRMADVDIAAVLRLRLRGFHERLAERSIRVESDIHEAELIVNADATRIQQLFSNLMENSIRYTNAGGRWRVACHREDTRVLIDLQDSEPGVPAELLTRLFERFYRVDASRNRQSGGAGLGLAICKSIVEAHGGTITARESPLGGLWIRVALPTAR
ncbi:MAG: baeS [Gammaproteobacteria bacterium]|nr:baeS [Gammaproteobacteria bacterium]